MGHQKMLGRTQAFGAAPIPIMLSLSKVMNTMILNYKTHRASSLANSCIEPEAQVAWRFLASKPGRGNGHV